MHKVFLEQKGIYALSDEFTEQFINYLKVSGKKFSLLVIVEN